MRGLRHGPFTGDSPARLRDVGRKVRLGRHSLQVQQLSHLRQCHAFRPIHPNAARRVLHEQVAVSGISNYDAKVQRVLLVGLLFG